MSRLGWIIGSFFVVSGGFVLSSGALIISKASGTTSLLLFWGAGAIVSGLLAARASAGKTFLEPAVGSILFIVAIGGMFLLTDAGALVMNFMLSAAPDETQKYMGMIAGTFFVGSLVGAFLGEKLQDILGEGGQFFMILLAFFIILGGFFLPIVGLIMMQFQAETTGGAEISGGMIFLMIAVGSLLGGIVCRRGGAKFLATLGGCVLMGASLFALMLTQGKNEIGVVVVLAIFIAICASIGSGLGRIGLKKG